MSDQLLVHAVQINPVVGDLAGNLALIKREIEHTDLSVDLLVFPECALTGYPLQDLVLRSGFLSKVDQALDELSAWLSVRGGPALLLGAPLAGSDLPYNAAHLIRNDGSRQVALKTELPNNDVFDERRVFARGSDPTPLLLKDWKLGVMICEDMWHGPVARRLSDEGAECLIVLNGSPMEINKHPIRHRHAARRVADTKLPLLYLNLTGGQDEIVFDGSSFVLDEKGNVVSQAGFEPERLVFSFERTATHTTVSQVERPADRSNPVAVYPDQLTAIYQTLVIGLRDYVNKNGFSEVVLGLSGGLDSALVAALAVDALGPKRLLAFMLPAAYTGDESKSLAYDMADRLRCRYGSVPVNKIVESLEWSLDEGLSALGDDDLTESQVLRYQAGRKLASENLQARVRGNILMGISNARPGALVLSTGNKSEMSVGYATLYGDMCGGFNPIKDLYKTKVQALSKWRNENRLPTFLGPDMPIPEGIITRPPTAELAENQSDENTLGAYPLLDAVLEGLIEQQLGPAAVARSVASQRKEEVALDYVERIAKLVQRAEYKRRQAPPGIKVTGKSFGFGWRYPITNQGGLD